MESVNAMTINLDNVVIKICCIFGIFAGIIGLEGLLRAYILQSTLTGLENGAVQLLLMICSVVIANIFLVLTLLQKEFRFLHSICLFVVLFTMMLTMFMVEFPITAQIRYSLLCLMLSLLVVPVDWNKQ